VVLCGGRGEQRDVLVHPVFDRTRVVAGQLENGGRGHREHVVAGEGVDAEKHIDEQSGSVGTPWLFPGYRAGKHLDPQSIMQRLRKLGINLLGARNAAIQNLVAEVPPPLVAELLGYSYQVTHRHAELAAQPWSNYAT